MILQALLKQLLGRNCFVLEGSIELLMPRCLNPPFLDWPHVLGPQLLYHSLHAKAGLVTVRSKSGQGSMPERGWPAFIHIQWTGPQRHSMLGTAVMCLQKSLHIPTTRRES